MVRAALRIAPLLKVLGLAEWGECQKSASRANGNVRRAAKRNRLGDQIGI